MVRTGRSAMRLLSILLALTLLFAGCGGQTSFGFISRPGNSFASGTVSFVRLTVISDANGTSVTVTAVTLIASGQQSNFNFCGDQRGQFPMSQFVSATFVTATTCSNLISVR